MKGPEGPCDTGEGEGPIAASGGGGILTGEALCLSRPRGTQCSTLFHHYLKANEQRAKQV